MADLLKQYEEYASSTQSLLRVAGLWPGSTSSNLSRRLVIFHLFTNTCMLYGDVNFLIHHTSNIALITRSLGFIITCLVAVVRVSAFEINRDCLVKMHEILEVNFRKDLENSELRAVMLPLLKYFKSPGIWLARMIISLHVFYSFIPIMSIIIQFTHGANPIKYHTPYLTQYPWNFMGNIPLYATYYFMEILGGVGIIYTTAGTDVLFGFYVFQIATQFRALSYRMNNFKGTDDYKATIEECVVRHQTLTNCRDFLQQVYGPIVICLMITSAVSLCVNIFQTSKLSFANLVVTVIYIIVKLSQALIYAWYGMFLTVESEAFRDSVYNCDWPGSGERSLMSNVLIMLMAKPLSLTACHFTVISLDMFTAIANTALSYFFLLRTLEEGNR